MSWTHHLGKGDKNDDWHNPIWEERGGIGQTKSASVHYSFLGVLFLNWDVSNSDMSSVFVKGFEEEKL